MPAYRITLERTRSTVERATIEVTASSHATAHHIAQNHLSRVPESEWSEHAENVDAEILSCERAP